MEKKQHPHRPVVAFFNGNIHDPHSMTMIRLLYEGFQQDDIEFHYYMGADLNGFMADNLLNNLSAENHYYSLFSYAAYDRPDILIITMGGLTNSDYASSVEGFLSHFPGVPIILLENDTVFPQVTHVRIDNYAGMYAAVEHLIRHHGYRRIAHLAGPQKNDEAVLRRRAYENAMKDNGLPLGMIVQGDYTRNVEMQVRALLDSQPEAIAAANDVMATVVYELAQQRQLRIGTDLAVTGFDDAATSAMLAPPLTTVRQDYKRIADATLSQVRRFLRGEAPEDVLIGADLVCRCSCGCTKRTTQNAVSSEQILEQSSRIDRMIFQGLETTFVLRNMLYQEVHQEQMFCELGKTLHQLGAKRSFILLFDSPIQRKKREVVDAPEQIRIAMHQEGDTVTGYWGAESPAVGRGELRNWISTDERTTLTDFVLYYQDLEYGVLIVDIDPEQLLFFYSLSLEIGSGLRYLQLDMDREAAYQALEEKNQVLSYAASHDILTNLYNRAGIMSEILRYVHGFPARDRFLLVMADLDHLKQINDTFGHNEGDLALKYISCILSETLPAGSPIGRNGGDEFLAVVHLADIPVAASSACADGRSAANRIREQLRQACARANEECRPYYLDISACFCEFGMRDLGRLLQIIEKADQDLYEAKNARRPDVRR